MQKLKITKAILAFTCIALFVSLETYSQNKKLGIFEGNSDIGKVLHKGSVTYNPQSQTYEITGSGTNIWTKHDEFHFVWKKLKGDFILQLNASLIGKGVDPHRKYGWMVRTSLDSGSAHISAAVHGDGLTSLQYRPQANAEMAESRSTLTAPDVLQLERRGNKYIMSAAKMGDPFTTTEIADINVGDDVYVGLYVCSHNKNVVEKARFDNVRIIIPAKENFIPYKDYIGSHIELMDVSSGKREIIYTENTSLQAPNWTPDNKSLIYNCEGEIYNFDLKTRKPKVLNTDFVKNNNNDHVLSFDGKMLGLSSSSGDKKFGSMVYTVPVTGGKPKQITPTGPSYLHGWSPDKQWLIFTGQRNDDFDIYRIPANGGPEEKLTEARGLDDGSEYTPDGKYIYFNSNRTGLMQIWRMKADGSDEEQVTFDDYNNWFPHISPDGKSIVILSFSKDIKSEDHPFYQHVYIRLMPISGGKPKVIAYLYGGQGSINTPSWSPDSKKIAFISNTQL